MSQYLEEIHTTEQVNKHFDDNLNEIPFKKIMTSTNIRKPLDGTND